jgi:hypothetical protein
MIHHSNTTYDDCGERHNPGAQAECIDILKARAEDCAAKDRRIAELEQALNETYMDEQGTTWTRPTAEAYAKTCKALAERTKERDTFDATLRAVEAAIAEVYPAWLDAEDYDDAIQRLGQERDALAAALCSIKEYLYEHEDITDSEQGPRPNWALRMVQEFAERFGQGSKLLSARLAAERKGGAEDERERILKARPMTYLGGFLTENQIAVLVDWQRQIESGEVKP